MLGLLPGRSVVRPRAAPLSDRPHCIGRGPATPGASWRGSVDGGGGEAGSTVRSHLAVHARGMFWVVGATWRIGRVVTAAVLMPGRSYATTRLCAAAPGGSQACRRVVTSQETARKGAGDG